MITLDADFDERGGKSCLIETVSQVQADATTAIEKSYDSWGRLRWIRRGLDISNQLMCVQSEASSLLMTQHMLIVACHREH